MDTADNIYLSFDNVVRRIDAEDGSIITIAGTGAKGKDGDYGPALDADLHKPRGLSVSPDGDLLIADWGNHAIRMIWSAAP